jgi:hypothetical protein
LIHEKLDKILSILSAKPFSKKAIADLASEFEKTDLVEYSDIATNTTPVASVAPSAISMAGTVTPRRIYGDGKDHPRPSLDIGKSPNAQAVLNTQGQPGPIPHQIPLPPSGQSSFVGSQPGPISHQIPLPPSGQSSFVGSQPAYGYEQNMPQGAPRPNWGPHPGSAYPGQYPPVPARPYFPQGNSRPPHPSGQSAHHMGYNGN